jgi:hypothetical protein
MALAAEPIRWDQQMRWIARQRDLRLTTQSLNLLGTEAGADVGHPLLAPRFLAALGKAGGSHGFGDLASLLRAQFGSLLPAELIARPGKAHFNEVFWGPYSREFVRAWGGEPAAIAFVDERSLFDMWCGTGPQTDAATVIQALWLSSTSPSDLSHTTHRED